MAKCDEGYLCDVCGEEVSRINDSDLYLRYIIGKVNPNALLTTPERHIRCNPVTAQFIVDERFEPVKVEGDFDKCELDPAVVDAEEALITRGWQRLQEVRRQGLTIAEYPLPEVLEKLQSERLRRGRS